MEKGLDSLEALEQQKIFGKNEIITQEKTSVLSLFFSQFPNFINLILVAASFLSFIVGSYIDSVFILVILLLNAIFGFVQEYRAEKSLDKLKTYVKAIVRVIRDGKEEEIDAVNLVPTDIVLISEGDRIPADGKIIANKFLEVDESVLTGESIPVIKNRDDEVLLGTLVTKGSSKIRVENIGKNTRFGEIAQMLANVTPDKTPLQKRLDGLARTLSVMILIVATFLIPLGIFQGKKFVPLLLLAVSIGIAAIPEGLPAVVAIALAIGTNLMAKRKAIVRRMQSVETLGAVQIILTDKTGTLTQNIMTVKKYWVGRKEYIPPLLNACVLGNTASVIEKTQGKFDIVGDKTDGALLLWARAQNQHLSTLKKEGAILEEYSFDPANSTVTTIWINKQNLKHIFVRGAPEVILEKSKISQQEKANILKIYEDFAKEGLRVIGFATRTSTHSLHIAREDAEKNLIFLGLVGIYDPPRAEAKKAVEESKKAGIQTIMVTGDNTLTAEAIAKEIGLLEKDDDIATGQDLEKLSDEELEKIILKTRIFARTKPEDKLRLVTTFKKMGYVVGVTGDGVNDALALKRADVGLAMGESGTDVAKEASDIILTDDNFSTVVSAVEEGRTIYSNILKSITYLLSGNLSEILFVFLSTLFSLPNPLFPTQILWINLVTDGLPALALASDIKDPNVLSKKPRDPNKPILSNHRLIFILTSGISLSLLFILVFNAVIKISGSETLARTIVFNLLIASHMALAFIVRGKLIFRLNRFLIFGVLFTLILQAVITFNPFFQQIFRLGF